MDDKLYGVDLFGNSAKPKPTGMVTQRFEFAPFSILDARQGEWQERKRAWTALGISGEQGRDAPCQMGGDNMASYMPKFDTGTSIFDPVICELMYRWFSPLGGQVLDPFAGGSVRGIVAKTLGRKYWGCDLRTEQIEANIKQAETIFEGYEGHSGKLNGLEGLDLEWVAGDSAIMLASAPKANFLFSCPPYGDLEVYSDKPSDLSNMDWPDFLTMYKLIINLAVKKMSDNSFACFVVGDFRDKNGFYRNFVSETIDAFLKAGCMLYNEAILVTAVGTAALRVTKQFNSGRKLCKTHQNVLVFCKGNPKIAAQKCIGDNNATTD